MIQVFDELLTEDQKQELQEEYGDVEFGTVAYTEDGTLPLVLSTDDGIAAGEITVSVDKTELSSDDSE